MAATFTSDKKIENSGGKFSIKTVSVSTENDKRDEHLKSPDFFDVKKYPEMTYVVKSAKSEGGENHFTLEGDLALHGVTKPQALICEYNGAGKV